MSVILFYNVAVQTTQCSHPISPKTADYLYIFKYIQKILEGAIMYIDKQTYWNLGAALLSPDWT